MTRAASGCALGGCAWVALCASNCRDLQTDDREIRGVVMPPGDS